MTVPFAHQEVQVHQERPSDPDGSWRLLPVLIGMRAFERVYVVMQLSHIFPVGASVKLLILPKQKDRSFKRSRFDGNIEQKVGKNTDPRFRRPT